jgi:signal transduction histidine kinase
VNLAVTLPAPHSQQMRRQSLLWLLYGTVFPPAVLVATVTLWPMWQDRPLLALGSESVSLALAATGVLLLDEPGQQDAGILLIISAALLTAGWLNIWKTGPWPLISVPASPLGTILAAWAMFRYPRPSSALRRSRQFFIVMTGWVVGAQLVGIGASRPGWRHFPARAWWPAVYPDAWLYQAAAHAANIGAIIFTVAYMVMWLGRWKQSRGIERRLIMPIAFAAAAGCGATLAELIALSASASARTMIAIYTVEAFLLACVPAAFVIAVLQRRFARTRIADLVVQLRGPAQPGTVTEGLRRVLHDPSLDVFYWVPDMGSYVDGEGSAIQHPAHSANRLVLPVLSSSGGRLAVVLADPVLSAHEELVQAAITASSLALENSHLQAALQAQLKEVRASRLRIVEAGMSERRRLEHDLHDGTQQRLLALKVMLGAAEAEVDNAAARATLSRIRQELGQVFDELRDLAHGIHPAVLSQVGLASATVTMAENHLIPIDVNLPDRRFPEATELTAYFVISEAISNAVKHASADRIRIRGREVDHSLRVEITDNGRGGARITDGTGIAGLADRVRALGGDLSVHSADGQGTRLEASIPCA